MSYIWGFSLNDCGVVSWDSFTQSYVWNAGIESPSFHTLAVIGWLHSHVCVMLQTCVYLFYRSLLTYDSPGMKQEAFCC